MKKRPYYLLFVVLLFTLWQSSAQEKQNNAWKALFTDLSLTNSTTLRLETHLRTRRFFAENDQYLLRPSISFKLGNKQQEHNLIDALKISCRKFTKEKTGKKPFTNINLVKI